MASLSPFLFSFILLFAMSFLVQCFYSGGNGLRIKLIHPDSVESPIYPGNISSQERFLRYHRQTEARMKSIALARATAKGHTAHPVSVRSPVALDGKYYFVKVGIGSFANQNPYYQDYYLVLDTGSSLIWTQCQGCNPCFTQNVPLYPYMNSLSYHVLPCNDVGDCIFDDYSCLEGSCHYEEPYAGGSVSSGELATETFTFDSENGQTETVENIVFGCGLRQTEFNHFNPNNNLIAGIFGMGAQQTSFLMQLGERGGHRFSYCLTNPGEEASTFLEFGDAAQFLPVQQPAHTSLGTEGGHYQLNLLDISVGDVRLNYPPNTFRYDPDTQKGGFELDLGSEGSVVHPDILDDVTAELDRWYSQFDGMEKLAGDCYRTSDPGFNSYSDITLHFENADMVLHPSQLYLWITDYEFCLGLSASEPDFPVTFLLGNLMQTNRRFVYDLQTRLLSFAYEDCSI